MKNRERRGHLLFSHACWRYRPIPSSHRRTNLIFCAAFLTNLFLDIIRADASKLVRLRHLGVVHVVQGLDERKAIMAMVTEPIFASVANVLGRVDNIAKVPKELKGLEMGQLEIKHGLLQLAESLGFLHYNARLIHHAISPDTIFITSSGAWKLGGFSFAIAVDQVSGDMNSVQAFHYPEYEMLCHCNPP